MSKLFWKPDYTDNRGEVYDIETALLDLDANLHCQFGIKLTDNRVLISKNALISLWKEDIFRINESDYEYTIVTKSKAHIILHKNEKDCIISIGVKPL